MPRINPDNWSDERKLSALVVIATAKRIARVKWILSRQEYELIRNGRQAFEDGEEVTAKSDLSSVELRQRLQHAIKQVVLGLKDFGVSLGRSSASPSAHAAFGQNRRHAAVSAA